MLSMMDVLSSSPHPKPIVNGKAVRNSEKTDSEKKFRN